MLHKFLLLVETDSLSAGEDFDRHEEYDLRKFIENKLDPKVFVYENFKGEIKHFEVIPS